METTRINENSLKHELVKEVEYINEFLSNELQEKAKEEGQSACLGGLELIPCSINLNLESNIKNILAIFRNNFVTSLYFQIEVLKR